MLDRSVIDKKWKIQWTFNHLSYQNYEILQCAILQNVLDKNYDINDLLNNEKEYVSNIINKGFHYINE